ncbi:uncharacterized protein B0I36DRAFT_70039 [Microdochium trichocladiopsis]|uniref:C2H2-type domain-containing protein n=1 Tax=Microdochium trichocladiopsis TaxID=1682393 RepID=A0A9P8YE02_9PEZI|nr:uncharacterized protein B0I36DRAFT_70039 [Microdochium trichocladiopsis]KAH7037715.1 hypothetical protein B0I36DRAFT_70039 [Microdochium trichocladiopsis]
MMAPTSGLFSFPQSGQADFQSTMWDTTDGAQTFQEEDFQYTYGHITPRGQDQSDGKWSPIEQTATAIPEPMRRVSSRSSAGSHKHRTMKATKHKSRPRLLSTVSQSSRILDFDITGNASMDTFLLPETDAQSVSSQMYYPNVPLAVGLPTDGLAFSAAGISPSMTQHIDPAHMQLHYDGALAGSPSASWGSSPVESRISSPGIPEDASAWSLPMAASPSQTSDSSPIMDSISPSLDRQMGLMTTDDVNANILSEDMFSLPPAFSRRSSDDGESSARNHPLYKTAFPAADGLFHCPWEGQASCNHKPEKLKCNYDKFVDSHLKPYRCKITSCENARFSSTACLLRHEREAHAMHGHGDKPYLCTYEGCDRAVPGNGFPRNWNLKDHMRRVHNDNGSSMSIPSGSPVSSQAASQAHKESKSRKRKSKDVSEAVSSSRRQSSRSAEVAAARAAEQAMVEEWHQHRKALDAYLTDYSSPDAFDIYGTFSDAQSHMTAMGKITQQLHSKKARASMDAYTRRSYGEHSG